MCVSAPIEEQPDIVIAVPKVMLILQETRAIPALPLANGRKVPNQNPQHALGETHKELATRNQIKSHLPTRDEKTKNGIVRTL